MTMLIQVLVQIMMQIGVLILSAAGAGISKDIGSGADFVAGVGTSADIVWY